MTVEPLISFERAAVEIAGFPSIKPLVDASYNLKKETGGEEDFIERHHQGPAVRLSVDATALICGAKHLVDAGYPLKFAALIMSRVRTAMQEHPDANQFVNVTLENGFNFTIAADTVDLSSGFNSGGYVSHFVTIDIRNLRERVRRAMEAENVAA